MSYGYSGQVVLPVQITMPAGLAPGTRVTLRGAASWLVCERICIPEEAPVAVTLAVASGAARPDPQGAPLIAAARRAVPTPSPWPASFVATPDTFALTVEARDLVADRVADVWFYPARWGVIEHAAPQRSRVDGGRVVVEVARGQLAEATAGPVDGVLMVAERLDGRVVPHAFTIRAEPRRGATSGSLVHALILALAGGLILNLMPCVLPVLSVKALALLDHEGRGLRAHGLAYTAGVLASFAALAGALLALRAGGEQIGWGFQLQSPAFVALLAYVLLVMALALSGVLVVGGRLAGVGRTLAARSGYAGSFFTGALATIAATPCTAPFMGVAVGFAVTQPWPLALLVFEALGLGLALPYLVLTLAPRWRRLLPRPGAWMERLKQLLAFPLYASVAWLLWVVSQQAGSRGLAAALAGVVLIAFAAWLFETSRDARPRWRRAGVATVAITAATAVALVAFTRAEPPPGMTAAGETGWEPYSADRLAALRAGGTPVLVDVTAAWCITCLVNERVALRAPAVAAAFARKGVTVLRADWTGRDPAITRMLSTFGRNGVPLYLLYPGGVVGEPAILPQILTEGTIIDAVDRL